MCTDMKIADNHLLCWTVDLSSLLPPTLKIPRSNFECNFGGETL